VVELSQWQPDGGYVYYEAQGYTTPLGDDLPNPAMPQPTKLGVPSIEAGHALPRRARRVGEGDMPRGVLVPMDTSRLGAVLPTCGSPLLWALGGAAAVGLIWFVQRGR
jgi:hypothetical protein